MFVMVESFKVFQYFLSKCSSRYSSELRSFRVSSDRCCPDMPRLSWWIVMVPICSYEVRMKLLGRVKNAVKSTALPDLLDAVEVRGHESWWGTLMNQFSWFFWSICTWRPPATINIIKHLNLYWATVSFWKASWPLIFHSGRKWPHVQEVWVSRGGHELPPRQPVEVVELLGTKTVRPSRLPAGLSRWIKMSRNNMSHLKVCNLQGSKFQKMLSVHFFG